MQEVPIRAIFEIICEAKGVPHPVISWRKNGIDLENDKVGNRRVLTVEIKSRDDSGTIECLATNGVGTPAVDTLHINVLCKFSNFIEFGENTSLVAHYILLHYTYSNKLTELVWR